jgi:serine/threonine protein kinase
LGQGNDLYRKKNRPSEKREYIALEIAEGGELFDYIASGGRFPEPLARYYFK